MNKVCETGPPVYRPYPRRLESLIICRCHYKRTTGQRITFKNYITSMSCVPEPAMQSCDTGQRIPFFDSCQLITTCTPNCNKVVIEKSKKQKVK